MKGIKIGLIILSLFVSANIVKADTIQLNVENKPNDIYNESATTTIYNTIIPNNNEYNYYIIIYHNMYNSGLDPFFEIIFFNNFDSIFMGFTNSNVGQVFSTYVYTDSNKFCEIENTNNNTEYNCNNTNNTATVLDYVSNVNNYEYGLYDTNYNLRTTTPIEIGNYYEDSIILNTNDTFPTLRELSQYNSWSDYENEHLEGYTEVNLDNYEYVLLSLKNYSQSQAFQTNLQVKGQIGITPIYNFGQTSKDTITGVQVQDRCNVSYTNYTAYPFYILQSDLQNNAIYAVKECSQESSFKFDNSVFDITYITQENVNNPTVTINGNTYDVIKYADLPSTATENEEDNYIPGESGSASDTGGLDSAIKGAQQKLGEIWNSITYFTDFIGQIFSSLPEEIHSILISAFIIMIMLGIIKIFLGH